MVNRLRFPAALFFVASLFGLLQIYHAIGGKGWRLSVAALVYGLVLGVAVQACFRQPLPRTRVGVASFFGAFMLWVPVVLVSCGFALMATPVFLAYAGAVVLGVDLAARRRKALPTHVAT
jgi:hypothetical protein